MIIGLTGSIGMGKTTVSEMLRDRGVPVLCMDAITHRARGPGGDAVYAIEQIVPGCLDEMGGVNPQKLRAFAFQSPDNIAALEAIMRPIISRDVGDFIEKYSFVPVVVIDAPLLFEGGFDHMCDQIVVVSAGPEVQRERVLARGTMTSEQFEAILSRQMPDEEKRERADVVIDTSGSLVETRTQVDDLLKRLSRVSG